MLAFFSGKATAYPVNDYRTSQMLHTKDLPNAASNQCQ